MMTGLSVRILPASLAHRISVRVSVTFIVPIRFVVDLVRCVADVLLPVLGPVEILVAQLGRCFGIAAHDHAVHHAADEGEKAEYQEYHSEYPVPRIINEKGFEIKLRVPNSPNNQWLHELDNDDETQRHQN
jgi:hypothetical protein